MKRIISVLLLIPSILVLILMTPFAPIAFGMGALQRLYWWGYDTVHYEAVRFPFVKKYSVGAQGIMAMAPFLLLAPLMLVSYVVLLFATMSLDICSEGVESLGAEACL